MYVFVDLAIQYAMPMWHIVIIGLSGLFYRAFPLYPLKGKIFYTLLNITCIL